MSRDSKYSVDWITLGCLLWDFGCRSSTHPIMGDARNALANHVLVTWVVQWKQPIIDPPSTIHSIKFTLPYQQVSLSLGGIGRQTKGPSTAIFATSSWRQFRACIDHIQVCLVHGVTTFVDLNSFHHVQLLSRVVIIYRRITQICLRVLKLTSGV